MGQGLIMKYSVVMNLLTVAPILLEITQSVDMYSTTTLRLRATPGVKILSYEQT